MVHRVTATSGALALIHRLAAEHGELLFHQSGGCCDGAAPTCFKVGELRPGINDVLLGHIGGVPYYLSRNQIEYWQNVQLVVGVGPGEGATFSLENGSGLCFTVRTQLLSDDDLAQLAPLA